MRMPGEGEDSRRAVLLGLCGIRRSDEGMSNRAAIGYAILAGKRMGLHEEQLKLLENLMLKEMDLTGEEEAEEAYRNN